MNSKLLVSIEIAAFILSLVAVFVLTLLALDAFTIPYLTPFAHFLKIIISPFIPLFFPVYLGALIKTYRHAPYPTRSHNLFFYGGIAFQQLSRVINDMISLYDWATLWNGKGFQSNAVCGLNSCMGAWVQAGLLVMIVGGESLNLKWDGGWVQKCVDAVAAQSIKDQMNGSEETATLDMEKGQVVGEVVVLDEKKPSM